MAVAKSAGIELPPLNIQALKLFEAMTGEALA